MRDVERRLARLESAAPASTRFPNATRLAKALEWRVHEGDDIDDAYFPDFNVYSALYYGGLHRTWVEGVARHHGIDLTAVLNELGLPA